MESVLEYEDLEMLQTFLTACCIPVGEIITALTVSLERWQLIIWMN